MSPPRRSPPASHQERPIAAEGVGSRTLRGVLWAYGSFVGARALVFLSTVVLARLLVPEDFGAVALALVFMSFLDTVADVGLSQALIVVDEDEVRERANTVWTVTVLIGLGLALLVAAAGPFAAKFFDQPLLTGLMPALGLNMFLRALGSTHYALAQKWLDFRTRTTAELSGGVVRASTGIVLAFAGAGAWSLVVGYLVGTSTMSIVLWRRVDWRPHPSISRTGLREMVGFGGAITGVSVMGAVLANADDLIVGKVLGSVQLGFYTMAYRIPDLLIINLSAVVGQVLFPAMASLPREALPSAFLVSLRYGMMVGLPLAIGLGVLAEPLVVVTLGEKWRAAAPAMQVMALWTLTAPIGIIIGTCYKAVGRVDLLLRLAIPQALILVPAVILVAEDGIVWVSACQAAIAIVFTLIQLRIAKRLIGLSSSGVWGAVRPAVTAAAAMGLVIAGLDRLIASEALSVLVCLPAGVATYFGVLWLVARDAMVELIARLRPAGGPEEAPQT